MNSIFDQAEAAVARLLNNGRCFVRAGRVAAMVEEMAKDAEVEVTVRGDLTAGGWWIKLA